MFGRRKIRRFVDQRPVSVAPRMAVVFSAEQLAKRRPAVEGGQRDVRRHQPLAVVAHEFEQVVLLLFVDRHVAMAEKEDGVRHAKVRAAAGGLAGRLLRVHRRDMGVGADKGVVNAGVVAKSFDDGEGV
jgi:hypothetical protein